jgi:hypothetical protein
MNLITNNYPYPFFKKAFKEPYKKVTNNMCMPFSLAMLLCRKKSIYVMSLPYDIISRIFEYLPYSMIYEMYMTTEHFFYDTTVNVYDTVLYTDSMFMVHYYKKLNFVHVCIKHDSVSKLDNMYGFNNIIELDLICNNNLDDNCLLSLNKIKKLNIVSSTGLIQPNFSNMTQLKNLSICYSSILNILNLSDNLKLESLDVSSCYQLTNIIITSVTHLNELSLNGLTQLSFINLEKIKKINILKLIEVCNVTNIIINPLVDIQVCKLIKSEVSDDIFKKFKKTTELHLYNCENFTAKQFKYLKSLLKLYIYKCNNINSANMLYFSKLDVLSITYNDMSINILKRICIKNLIYTI